jgi:hypothetical protein
MPSILNAACYRFSKGWSSLNLSQNRCFSTSRNSIIFLAMSTVKENEAAIPKLSRAEIEQIREWIDDYLEDQLEVAAQSNRGRRAPDLVTGVLQSF